MIESITSEAGIEAALRANVSVVYKHSPTCAASAVGNTQIDRFAAEHPQVPVYRIDVVDQRNLALAIGRRLRVMHQSPQVILIRGGNAVWHASHYGIRATKLAIKLDETD